MSHKSPYDDDSHRLRHLIPCKLFLEGTCKNGMRCWYRHDPGDVTQLERCEDFWRRGRCFEFQYCTLAHVLESGKVLLSVQSLNRHLDELLSSESPYSRLAKPDLPELDQDKILQPLQPKRRLIELDHDDGDVTMFVPILPTSGKLLSRRSQIVPPAKRPRTRKNRKNIPKETWDYIDYEIRRLEEEGYIWEVWVDEELVGPNKVRKRTSEVVTALCQTQRSHASTRGPAPERPPNCFVCKERIFFGVDKDPSGLTVLFKKWGWVLSERSLMNNRDPSLTLDCDSNPGLQDDLMGLDPCASELSAHESLSLALQKVPSRGFSESSKALRNPTAAFAAHVNWTRTIPDSAEYQQNDVFDAPVTEAIQAQPELSHKYQSPEISAVTSPLIPILLKTAAAPATSAVSAISHLSRLSQCSWKNFPLGSQQSCVFMKSPARSIERPLMVSKAYENLLSASMSSIKV